MRLRASQAKNKRPLNVPLRGELRVILERRAEDRRPACPFVFHRDGKRLGDYRKAWAKAAAAAGVGGTLVHDLRRSAARNGVRAGAREQVVIPLGGWRTRSVFARYNITSDEDLGEALECVTGYVEKRRTEKPKVRPLRAAPAQNPHNPDPESGAARAEIA